MTQGATELSLRYEVREWQTLDNNTEKKYLEEIQNDLKNNNWKQPFQEQNQNGWSQAWDLTHLQEIGLLGKDWQLSYENIYENKNLTQTNRALLLSITKKADLYIDKKVYEWDYVKDNELLSNVLDEDWIRKYVQSITAFNDRGFKNWKMEIYTSNNEVLDMKYKWQEVSEKSFKKLSFWEFKAMIENLKRANLSFSEKDAWETFINSKYININWRKFPNPNVSLYDDEWNESLLTSLTDADIDKWFDLGVNFFDYDKSEVKDEINTVFTDKKIDQIKLYLQKNLDKKLNIDAYASEEWEADHNKKLSQDRADAIKKWLESKWISADKIVSNWKWETNRFWAWQEDYEKNRRTLISFS